jgi:4-hydroxy-tetrahydrodipicolinate reductase
MINVGIGGVYGRMGQAVVQAVSETHDLKIAAGVARAGLSGHAGARQDFPVSAELRDHIDLIEVFIDFSSAAGMAGHLKICAEAGVPYAGGVTGLEDAHREALVEASTRIPVFYAANFSIGVAVVAELVRQTAGWMPDADVEVVELHHRRKRDAPSGTAIVLIEAIEEGRADDERRHVFGRSGESPRQPGEIGVHSLRGGGNPGEHQVLFATEGEEVWIGHRALSRSSFAAGALRAARWVTGQPPGLYGMSDLQRPEP